MNKSIPTDNLPESNHVQILGMDEKELERHRLLAIYEFRRQCLLKIKKDFCNDSSAELSERINREPSYISRMLLPEGNKNKKRISDTVVSAIEAKFPGWLDKDGAVQDVNYSESATKPSIIGDSEWNALSEKKKLFIKRVSLGGISDDDIDAIYHLLRINQAEQSEELRGTNIRPRSNAKVLTGRSKKPPSIRKISR